jgi:hypothetical protein
MTAKYMKTKEIVSLSDYIDYVEKECQKDYILFRGQRADYPLAPKITRINCRGNLLQCELQMLEKFKRFSKPHLNRPPTNDWEWLSLAQHHGMATRLLDWSLNPLAALWFAVERPIDKGGYGVVWIFDAPEKDILKPSQLITKSPFEGQRTSIYQPDIMTARIQSQSGWFTVHKYIAKNKGFVPLEKNRLYKNNLRKIKIPAEAFQNLRYHLDRLGVNRMLMFPDLDGIAKHVEWLKSFDEDEDNIFGSIPLKKRS